MKIRSALFLLSLMTTPAIASAQTITVDGVEVVQLRDAARHIVVSIAPHTGNMAYEMKVNGKNAFWFPFASIRDFAAKPEFAGNPFLAPWANRIDAGGYYANGKKYLLNPGLGNLRPGGQDLYIHGLLNYSDKWKVIDYGADAKSAHVTSRLEFFKYPELMANFPFAHSIDMTYRLVGGDLVVETTVHNLGNEPMPLAIGYHPYFQLPGVPRDEWNVHLAADEHLEVTDRLVPTGVRKKMDLPQPFSLKGGKLDDGFVSLRRDADGTSTFFVEGGGERVSVIYGPKYPVAVVYAPPGKDFICFEPMTAITNAFNLHQDGKYPELQSIPAGGEWHESFRIRVSGF